MGGERASTARQRLAGKNCCRCQSSIPPPYPGRERVCDRCKVISQGKHRLHMKFEKCLDRWRVSFRDLEDRGASFRELTFADSAKIEDLVARTATRRMLEDRQALENGIRSGLGALTLTLTAEQYSKLVR